MTQASTTPNTAATAVANIVALVTAKLGATQAAALAPVINQYAPAFVAMSAADIWAWITLAVNGDPFAAYAAIVAKLANQDLVDQWGIVANNWRTQNTANAQSVAWQRNALAGLLNALVGIALAMVGL